MSAVLFVGMRTHNQVNVARHAKGDFLRLSRRETTNATNISLTQEIYLQQECITLNN